MKNIKLIALIFLTVSLLNNLFGENSSFNLRELFKTETSASSILQLKQDEDLEISGGTKIAIPFVEGCFYKKEEKYNWAGSFSSKLINNSIPVNIKAGNLSYSGIISKINNPSLFSSISPFGVAAVNTTEITSVLPTYTSFSNPISFFSNICYSKKTDGLIYLNTSAFCVPYERFGVNVHAKYKIHKNTIGFSQIIENFSYEESKSDSWYSKAFITKKDFYFPLGNNSILLNQINYSSKNYSTLFTFGIYENLWKGIPAFVFKTENKLAIKQKLINFSLFLNPNQTIILTGSQKKLENCIQGKITFQQKKLLAFEKGGFLRTGAGIFFDSPIYYNSSSDFTQTIKNSFGAQVILSAYRLTGTFQIDSSIKQTEPVVHFGEGMTVTLKSQWYLDKLQTGLSGNFTYKKNETNNAFSTSEKLTLSVSFCKNPRILVNSSLQINQKNLIHDSLKFSASVSTSYSWNKINFQFRAKN